MTPYSNHFSTYSPCPSNKKIATADGTLVTVAGLGDIHINPSITLKNVLHVPKLSTNLVSIHKLTKDLSCTVIFDSNHCEFRDKVLGTMIGRAREWNDLYYLEETNGSPNDCLHQSFMTDSLLSNKEKIFLYHYRLGHPAFRTLRILFPSLFTNLDVEGFSCEVCEMAKHKHIPFPISNERSVSSFYLIHSDVWGPSVIPNVSGARWFVTFIDDCTRVS